MDSTKKDRGKSRDLVLQQKSFSLRGPKATTKIVSILPAVVGRFKRRGRLCQKGRESRNEGEKKITKALGRHLTFDISATGVLLKQPIHLSALFCWMTTRYGNDHICLTDTDRRDLPSTLLCQHSSVSDTDIMHAWSQHSLQSPHCVFGCMLPKCWVSIPYPEALDLHWLTPGLGRSQDWEEVRTGKKVPRPKCA